MVLAVLAVVPFLVRGKARAGPEGSSGLLILVRGRSVPLPG